MAGPAPRSRETALAVARLLDDHKAADTVVLDLAGVSSVADFFVIATARSSAHLAGLARELAEALRRARRAAAARAQERRGVGMAAGGLR